MEQIYYGVAIVVYGVFIVRFILSWVGGDLDMDTDGDMDLGDVVSFKGATHFLMGAFGWLSLKSYTTHDVQWYDFLIAFALGVIFVIILYFVYKLMMSLESKPDMLTGKRFIGKSGEIYLNSGYDDEDDMCKYIIQVDNNLGLVELPAKSKNCYTLGDKVVIKDFKNAYYII